MMVIKQENSLPNSVS